MDNMNEGITIGFHKTIARLIPTMEILVMKRVALIRAPRLLLRPSSHVNILNQGHSSCFSACSIGTTIRVDRDYGQSKQDD